MTDEEYRQKMLATADNMLRVLNDIKDYQKVIIVYLEAMADSPEFESAKQECAQKVKDMYAMIEITKRRWSA